MAAARWQPCARLLAARVALAIAVCSLLSLIARPASAGDPRLKWHTLASPHFRIHYYDPGYEVALRTARVAERAHEVLVPLLGHAPSSPLDIVLTDDTDGANGSASVLPYNVVRLYVTAPEAGSTLSDYDDWLYGLVVHEYSHILHLDQIGGLARVLNHVLGKTFAPNQVQPRWFVEGLATFEESEQTSSGRIRSAIFDMYLRAATLEGKLPAIDQVSSGTLLFPHGTIAYLYGSHFVKWLADRYGEAALREISRIYGSTIIPFSINRVVKRVVGRDYLTLYTEWRQHLEHKYGNQAALVRRRGLTPYAQLTSSSESHHMTRFAPDGGEVVFWESTGYERARLVLMTPDGRQRRLLTKDDPGMTATFTPDGQRVVFEKSEVYRTNYYYSELFVMDRDGGRNRGRATQLTSGLRAREPDLSPDGRLIACSVNQLGTSQLAILPFDGERVGSPEIFPAPERFAQVSTPAWSPDGRTIAYSGWTAGGFRDLFLVEVASRKVRRLWQDRAEDIDPRFSADGRFLYFASDRTGIYNIFAYELASGRLLQVTNVLGGAFSPAPSPDGRRLVYVGFSAAGYDVHAMDLDPGRFSAADPYVSDRPPPTRIPDSGPTYPIKRYNPLRTLWPHNYRLGLSNDAYGQALDIMTGGTDAVGYHSFSLAARVGLERPNFTYGLSYSYDRLWPDISLGTGRYVGRRGGLVLDGVRRLYTEEDWSAWAAVRLPLVRRSDRAVDLSFGYSFDYLRNADAGSYRLMEEPSDIVPVLPEIGRLASLSIGFGFSNARSFLYSISPEEGRSIGLNLRLSHPLVGSSYQSFEVTYRWVEYLRMPWLRRHVLALRLAGGAAASNMKRRGVFAIGGFPDQDWLRSLLDQTRMSGAYLRGYDPGSVYGDQYHLLNVEYRFPIIDIERGIDTLPFYVRRLHATVFCDYGNAFFGSLSLSDFKVGVGGELLLDLTLGYVLGATLRVGLAQGLSQGGGTQFSIVVGVPY